MTDSIYFLLQLVHQILHVVVLLLVLVRLELELLQLALRLPEVLGRVAEATLFTVEFVLELVNPGFKFGRRLLPVLQRVHLGLVKTDLEVLERRLGDASLALQSRGVFLEPKNVSLSGRHCGKHWLTVHL